MLISLSHHLLFPDCSWIVCRTAMRETARAVASNASGSHADSPQRRFNASSSRPFGPGTLSQGKHIFNGKRIVLDDVDDDVVGMDDLRGHAEVLLASAQAPPPPSEGDGNTQDSVPDEVHWVMPSPRSAEGASPRYAGGSSPRYAGGSSPRYLGGASPAYFDPLPVARRQLRSPVMSPAYHRSRVSTRGDRLLPQVRTTSEMSL